MLRQDSSGISPDSNGLNSADQLSFNGPEGLELQRQLQQLEEIILGSPRLPLTRRTLVDEEQLLKQLDQVRLSLPTTIREAEEVLRLKEEILTRSQEYAEGVVKQAKQRAAQILDERGIIQQAELEAQQIRQQAELEAQQTQQRVQQECDVVQQRTLAEVERIRRQAQQELEDMRRASLAECEQIQTGADTYADRVLTDMELQLNEVLQVVRNSRHHLRGTSSKLRSPNE